jgi:stage IV sporulation protein FA
MKYKLQPSGGWNVDMKNSIRERRQDRIRSIQSRMQQRAPQYDRGEWNYEPGGGRQLPDKTAGYRADDPERLEGAYDGPELGPPRYDDPERAWHERERQLLSEWRGSEAGGGGRWRLAPTRRQLWTKLTICAVIYGLTVGLFQLQSEWASDAKRWVRAALTEDMRMDDIAAWYDKTFSGAPSFIPAFLTRHKEPADKAMAKASGTFHHPVVGTVLKGFGPGHPFVELATKQSAPVVAMDAGLITFAGVQDGSGYSLTIQHAGGYRTTYSGLEPGKWEKNDWVNAGDTIGLTAPGTDGAGKLSFSVMKDGSYVNPMDVVSFD